MEQLFYFLLLVTIINMVNSKSVLHDFYWRDYNGIIPGDALRAGHDQNGKPIYIGQVIDRKKLIPGKIFENDENIYYEFEEQAWFTNQNVKILCTENPSSYKWILTTIDEIPKLRQNTILVNGGYQKKFLTFIGRIQVDGRTDVGKVICRQKSCLGLYTNRDGSYQNYHEFEILIYDPSIENDIPF